MSRGDTAGLTDPRVVHLWDAKDTSRAWLAGNIPGHQASDWDTNCCWAPRRPGKATRPPLRSAGAPVFDQIQRLSQALDPLLTPGKRDNATASARRLACSTLGRSGPRLH